VKKNRIGGYVAIAVGVAIAASMFSSDSGEKIDKIFHITLADPNLYENGIFTEIINIQKGDYQFRFVPNGDSPEILSIKLEGNYFTFSEDFELVGIPHETGLSVYYTWDYVGLKEIQIDENQQLRIEVNPHNNLLGPVSIELVKLV